MNSNTLTWLMAIRPKTLPASIGPVLLGSSLAYDDLNFRWLVFFLTLLCAILLQVAVNLANDYCDGVSGVDTEDRIGPKRVTQSNLLPRSSIKFAIFIVTFSAISSGLILVSITSWYLLLFGVLSILAVFLYSGGPKPLASIALGEFTVFLFFGLLAVGGTYFAQTNSIQYREITFGIIVGLINAAIMLVNNIRDRDTDSRAGKKTSAVRMGDRGARIVFQILIGLSLLLHALNSLNSNALLIIPILATCPLSFYLMHEIRKQREQALNRVLAQTAMLCLLYCCSTSGALLFG